MSTPRVARARELAEQLSGAGIAATADVTKLSANLPAVLIGPPRLAYTSPVGALATWRLLAVASTTDETTAWEQLDALVDAVGAQLPLELAEPTAWAPSPADNPLPAYALTFTETVE